MALLIDGYNLLHATDIFGAGPGPDTLQGSREALLDFLVAALPERELRETTIVFDAAEAPPGLPRQTSHHGMAVRFADSHEDADTLIEKLIEEARAPKTLKLVSSDHRLHRAARRRKVKAVDSEVWYAEMRRAGRTRHRAEPPAGKPQQAPKTEAEVEYWLKQFGEPPPAEPTNKLNSSPRARPLETDSPFPPDYCDDLLE